MRTQHVCAALLVVIVLTGCSTLRSDHQRFFRMDTITDVTVVVRGARDLAPVWSGVDSLLRYWDEHFSVEGPRSEVRALNTSTDTVVPVSATMAAMLSLALRYSDTLGGTWDITVLPLKRLWGLDDNSAADTVHTLPSDSAIAAARAMVDYRRVRVDVLTKTVRRPPGVLIDAGGIAKGYALQDLCTFLQRHGFTSYLVAAGDIAVAGRRPDGKPWRVGIQHPRRPDTLLTTITVDSGFIFTSGDYERYWMAGTRRIHHIFDPFTGLSCTRNQSLTVWGADALEAKVLSTGLFGREPDSILAWIARRPGHECLVVDSSGGVHVSAGWKSLRWQ